MKIMHDYTFKNKIITTSFVFVQVDYLYIKSKQLLLLSFHHKVKPICLIKQIKYKEDDVKKTCRIEIRQSSIES